jgi:hypothetical protein
MSIPFRRTAPFHVLRRSVARGFGLALICAIVGACSVLPEGDAPPPVQPAGIAVQADVAPVAAPPTARARPMRKPAPLTTPQLNAATAPDRLVPDLLGQDEAAILESLGEPGLRTRQGSIQLWHYARTDCALDLLFFFDLASDRFLLALVRRDGADVDPTELTDCISQVPADRTLS